MTAGCLNLREPLSGAQVKAVFVIQKDAQWKTLYWRLFFVKKCYIEKCSNCRNNCSALFGVMRKTSYGVYLIKEEINFIATSALQKLNTTFSLAQLLISVGRSMISGSVKRTLIQMKVSPHEVMKHISTTGFAQLLLEKLVGLWGLTSFAQVILVM